MTIEPTGSAGNLPLDPARIKQSRPAGVDPVSRPAAEAGREPERGSDSVEVSPEARALADRGPVRDAEGTLEPARLREVIDRIASGFHDRPEVLDQIAQRILKDPDFSPTE